MALSCLVKNWMEHWYSLLGVDTHSFFFLPWKKLAHSKQVFLLPTQKTDGIPTTRAIRYFIRKRMRSGRLVCVTYNDKSKPLRLTSC